MGRPEFLADHDLNERIVVGVRRRESGVRFVRVRDLGLQHLSDDGVLEYAAREGFIVVSHDVKTMSAGAVERTVAGRSMSGLLLAQQRGPVAPIIDDIVLIWSASSAEEWENQIGFLPLC